MIDPGKQKKFQEYLDDILPENPQEPHPFTRFKLNEIVIHAEWGTGIVTGFRIPDLERELEGLGVQFVERGRMVFHRVFTPKQCSDLTGSGIVFDCRLHRGKTLEEILET